MLHGYTHNQDDKAQLINDNLDVVKKIAFYYVGRVGKVVEVDDLLQLGMVGLIEAAHNYTPKEDVSFVSYAKLRIKGAIVDYLRKSSNLPYLLNYSHLIPSTSSIRLVDLLLVGHKGTLD